jgi:hypothetical protein
MPPLTITGTSANGIQIPTPDPITGGPGSLVLFDGWIDVDFASSGSGWVDAVAEFDRGPVWDELNLEFVNAEAALASIEGQEGSCGWKIVLFGPSTAESGFPPVIQNKQIAWVLRLQARGPGARINRVAFHVSALGRLSIGNTNLPW